MAAMKTWVCCAMGWVLASACTLVSVDASAGPSPQDKAAARSLFDQGRALVKAGKFDQACPKFEESYKLEPGIGASFNLADCYESIGKTASAWSGFLEAASLSKISGQVQREKVARDRAKNLEARLSRLVIEVAKAGEVDGLELRRDGTTVGKGVWVNREASITYTYSIIRNRRCLNVYMMYNSIPARIETTI